MLLSSPYAYDYAMSIVKTRLKAYHTPIKTITLLSFLIVTENMRVTTVMVMVTDDGNDEHDVDCKAVGFSLEGETRSTDTRDSRGEAQSADPRMQASRTQMLTALCIQTRSSSFAA